jgi:esterase
MKLFFRTIGKGTPLIILHGLYGSSDNWVSIAKTLAPRFTVYLPDLRNHGQSPHSEIHDYESMSRDLFGLVSDLNLRKFYLAGHSMGGKTAVAFASRWPDKLNGLLVADISPFVTTASESIGYNQHLSILSAMLSLNTSDIVRRDDADRMLTESISSASIRGLILKNLRRDENGKYSWKLNVRALWNNLDHIMEAVKPAEGPGQTITGFPVIFLKGSLSNYISPSDLTGIRRIFPAADFRVINGAGHWLHSDRPEEVIQAIRDLTDD